MNSPLLVEDTAFGPAAARPPGPRAPLADALRRSLVPSSVQELRRRGYRDVKVLPRDAVERMVAEAAERLVEDRLGPHLAAERSRLAEALERARRDLAAEREEREALDRWRADAVRRLEDAEARAREAEARLADARAGFEAQLAAVLADPRAFAALLPAERKRRRARALARRRVKAAVKRLVRENRELKARFEEEVREAFGSVPVAGEPVAPSKAPLPPARPKEIERIARLSFGFGNPRAERGFLAPPSEPPPAPGAAPVPSLTPGPVLALAPGPAPPLAPAPEATAAAPAARVDLGPIARRLEAIEGKLEALLGRLPEEPDEGIPSKYRDGRRAGLRTTDAQYRAKSTILRRLLEENVKLQKGPAPSPIPIQAREGEAK